jgi:two-component system nitrate/nitrite response regulator NarL
LIQVLLVAPYASVRAGLRSLLVEASDCEIVGEARDEDTLTYLLSSLTPDVVLYDTGAGPMEPLLAPLHDKGCALVALCEDERNIVTLAQSGMRGWAALLRSADGEEIAGAIRAVHAGIIALDRSFSSLLTDYAAYIDSLDTNIEPLEGVLTAREREVLQLMAQGLPNKNIAARLHISLSTAKFHVASILAKLDAASRTEAVTTGARRGLVSL